MGTNEGIRVSGLVAGERGGSQDFSRTAFATVGRGLGKKLGASKKAPQSKEGKTDYGRYLIF